MADETEQKPPKTKIVPEYKDPVVSPGVDPNILALTQTMAKMVEAMQASAMTPDSIAGIINPIVKEIGSTVHAARWPENAEHPHISAFSYPEGDIARPKPTLSRKTYFNFVEEEEDRLTPVEIDCYNAIVEPKLARGGAWKAEIKLPSAMGGKPELFVSCPANTVDQRMQLPSLILILHELQTGQSSEDVFDLLKQIAALKDALIGKGATADELEKTLLKA